MRRLTQQAGRYFRHAVPQYFDVGVYQPRNPGTSDYFRCVQDRFEQLEMLWQDRYAPLYGFWRPYVIDVIYRYLKVRRSAF